MAVLAGIAATLSPTELLRLADRPRGEFPEAVIHVKVSVSEKGSVQQPAEFDLYRKGEERTFIAFTAGKQKGRKILSVGEKFWILVPGSSRAIPVSARERLLGGASISEIAKLRLSEEFDSASTGRSEPIADRSCVVLDLKPKRPGAAYSGATLWVDEQEHLARKAVLEIGDRKPSKEILFESYEKENGVTVLRKMSVRDLLSRDAAKTTLEYTNYRKARLPDSMFTPEEALKF